MFERRTLILAFTPFGWMRSLCPGLKPLARTPYQLFFLQEVFLHRSHSWFFRGGGGEEGDTYFASLLYVAT